MEAAALMIMDVAVEVDAKVVNALTGQNIISIYINNNKLEILKYTKYKKGLSYAQSFFVSYYYLLLRPKVFCYLSFTSKNRAYILFSGNCMEKLSIYMIIFSGRVIYALCL